MIHSHVSQLAIKENRYLLYYINYCGFNEIALDESFTSAYMSVFNMLLLAWPACNGIFYRNFHRLLDISLILKLTYALRAEKSTITL